MTHHLLRTNLSVRKQQELERKNPRFKRMITEYESITDELWEMQNDNSKNVADDLLNAMEVQSDLLSDAIEEYLQKEVVTG